MRLNMQVTGVEQLARNLIGAGRMVSRPGPRQPLEESVLAGGRIIAADARQRAPRSSGRPSVGRQHAADTIAPRIPPRGSRDGMATAMIGPGRNHFYLVFHEIGTSKLPARPFLQPAMEEKRREAVAAMGAVYRAAIRNFARQVGRRAA